MPRLSLYRPDKSNDFKFIDRTIKEMFVVGGTDLYIHKYLGVPDTGASKDLTQPQYDVLDPTNIQDLLFLENRDRKYDSNIYRIRGHYSVQNLDFDLSQFGLFLNNDIILITIHINDMIELIGRKLMVGDVLELPHLTDYHPMNEAIPVGLRRYYQVTDGNFGSEGFSQTWYPHLWRIKCEPLVDSQEFSNILSAPVEKDNYLGDWSKEKTYVVGYTVTYGDKTYTPKIPVPAGIAPTDTTYWELSAADNLRDILGRYNTNIKINDAVIAEAARLLPKSGFDRSQLYVVPTVNGEPAPPVNIIIPTSGPVPTRATVELFVNPQFRSSSPVLRVGAAAIKKLWDLTSDDATKLAEYITLNLKTAQLAPERTNTGTNSGQVNGKLVLMARAAGPITGPYGTSDNTYATADQIPSFLMTGLTMPVGSTIIGVQSIPSELTTDADISAIATTDNGTIIQIFQPGTRVESINALAKTFTINLPTVAFMVAGTAIRGEVNFTGTISQSMDFRADSDPRFQFIARSSPQGFGYTDGYMIGDGTAPNGLPVSAGITFPAGPTLGSYFLRTDYVPNLLFRWDGAIWVRIGADVRTGTAFSADDKSMLSSFINNTNVTTLSDGTTIPEQQSLSTMFTIQPD